MDKTQEMEGRISDFWDNLKHLSLQKFRKGREEHGENFEEINYDYEIIQEVCDVVNYLAMRDYVRNNTKS